MKFSQVKKAVILAGGLGTRLRSVLPNTVKPMALINGIPFLEIILMNLSRQNIEEVIICIGYKSEQIFNYFGYSHFGIKIKYAKEKVLLGTGGGIINACMHLNSTESFFVLNGDTFFDIDLDFFSNMAREQNAKLSIALFKSKETRYGDFFISDKQHLRTQISKSSHDMKARYLAAKNGGVYFINNKLVFDGFATHSPLNFEQDILKVLELKKVLITGKIFFCDFIDIGIPSDYKSAAKLKSIKETIKYIENKK
ncbi:sugar phosphate nucleotidyltransferase [Alphaproteobacteria bacterium]|nr:sugar phosphate nucleotidyltransferase [Alphaproteobacteria bacterium]